MTDLEKTERDLESLRAHWDELRQRLHQSIIGYREEIEMVLLSILADGHVLLEGAPGLGKTTLVGALANALDLSFQRIQFTPDLMPGDIIGSRILEEDEGGRRFVFQRGPIFANLILADEINRATPRTQSALLEAMQEHQVTVFGETLTLEPPFSVIATQNPVEMEGTYSLPEAQLDRFMTKIELGTPSEHDMVRILELSTRAAGPPAGAVLERERVLEARAYVRQVPASDAILSWVARGVLATHPTHADAPAEVRENVRYGASPRGASSILLLAKARALVAGRLHVAEEDVEAVAVPALRHRLILSYEGEANRASPDELAKLAMEKGRR